MVYMFLLQEAAGRQAVWANVGLVYATEKVYLGLFLLLSGNTDLLPYGCKVAATASSVVYRMRVSRSISHQFSAVREDKASPSPTPIPTTALPLNLSPVICSTKVANTFLRMYPLI